MHARGCRAQICPSRWVRRLLLGGGRRYGLFDEVRRAAGCET
jgi:hypothetical protein